MKQIMELSFSLAQDLPASRVHAIADGLIKNRSENSLLESVGNPRSKEMLNLLLDTINTSGIKKK